MYTIEKFHENEHPDETLKFITKKENWDVENQEYRKPEAENCTANLADCKIYWRGQYLIVEHDDIIQTRESLPYCFLEKAVHFMELDKPKEWKTLDKLIDLRMGIRQTEVSLTGLVKDILEGKEMTLELFNEFMALAREQDLEHHGSHTF